MIQLVHNEEVTKKWTYLFKRKNITSFLEHERGLIKILCLTKILGS